jgi:hypothetical protein
MVASAQQLRHFHEAVCARSHVQERSALVQMMQEDAALLADLSIVLVGSDQRYRPSSPPGKGRRQSATDTLWCLKLC